MKKYVLPYAHIYQHDEIIFFNAVCNSTCWEDYDAEYGRLHRDILRKKRIAALRRNVLANQKQ
jgi:hypothetical protein